MDYLKVAGHVVIVRGPARSVAIPDAECVLIPVI